MKEVISTVQVVYDAVYPGQTAIILFKDFKSYYVPETQEETFNMTSYKVTYEDDGQGGQIEKIERIREHSRGVEKATLDALRASMTIDSTDYTDVRNEEICKGTIAIIDADGIFGLTAGDLQIR